MFITQIFRLTTSLLYMTQNNDNGSGLQSKMWRNAYRIVMGQNTYNYVLYQWENGVDNETTGG